MRVYRVILIARVSGKMQSLESLSELLSSAYRNREKLSQSLSSALSLTASKIGEYKTNLLYSIKHSDLAPLSRKEIEVKESERAQLLGQWYGCQQNYKLLFVFRQTFWFTYREGIKQIQSDNGWGCMIRTVQMVFAEVLKRHLALTTQEKDRCELIGYFSEKREGAFSLSSVCAEGGISKRWTSALEVFSVFRKIMRKYPQHFGLQLEIYSLGVVYQKREDVLFEKYPAMVVLTTRVSLECIPEQLHGHFLELMDSASWVGSVGGVKGQALYIVGHWKSKVIFLDPHYVQSNFEDEQPDSYCCKSPRGIELSELNPSISYCYYFPTKEQHHTWVDWISATCQKHKHNLVFQFISQNCKHTPTQTQSCIQDQRNQHNDAQLEIISDTHSDSSEFQLLQ